MSLPPSKPQDYHVGWICAVQTEYVAACEFLDEEYPILPASSPHDNNTYTFGRIGHHNVVIACLPKGKYGLTSAASVAKDMLRSFPSIRFGMMVGIGGGAPSLKHDIRLGDVVVSSPVGRTGGVIHYEFGKTIQNQKFERTGALDAPPPMLLTALSVIGALHERKGHQIGELVSGMVSRNPRLRKKYQRPKPGTDLLYESSFIHSDRDQACDKVCSAETARLVQRNERTADEDNPKVHYGLIASADRLMKDAQVRDTLARDEEVLCFEMEAAGLVDHFPCVVIRGICDYSDTHKNDIWQGYAAATAAAYAKELLHVIPVVERQLLSQFTLVPTVSAPKYSLGLNLCSAPLIEEGTFVGRAAEMKQLQEWLRPRTMPPTQNVVTIVGLGGLGKTQLSLEFAKQYHATYSTVFWLNAKDEITLKQNFRVVWQIIFGTVQSCSVENHTVEDQEVQQIRQWLSQHDNCKWLLLFDNYDDPKLPGVRSSTGYDIRQYFPYKSQGSILITTRSHRLTFARSLQLQKLNDLAQSLAILSNRSCRNIGSDLSAHSLAIRLDGLPLALATAGTYLSQTTESVAEYLDAYEEHWQELYDSAEELFDYEDRTLFTTWTLSLRQVRDQDPEAAELLRFLAYFGARDIQYELFQAADKSGLSWLSVLVDSKRRFERAMAKLCEYSLVDKGTESYSLHNCVHDWTLQALNPIVSEQYYSLALRCVASRVKTNMERDYWKINQGLIPHALRLEHSRFSKIFDKEVTNTSHFGELHSLGLLWDFQIEYSKAEQMYRRALSGKEEVLGTDHPSTLDTVNILGTLYRVQGRLVEAEQMYQRALSGREKMLGFSHPSTLNTVNNFGSLYRDKNMQIEAEQWYWRALVGREKVLAHDHPSTLCTVNNLGILYVDLGKLAEAEQFYRRALKGYEKVLGPDHPMTLDTVNNLGVLFSNQGKLDQAEQMYYRALTCREKVLGPYHTSTLSTVGNLGILYNRQSKPDEAEYMCQRALAGYEKVLGPDHPLTLSTIKNLCSLHRSWGKQVEAGELYQRALASNEPIGAAGKPENTGKDDTPTGRVIFHNYVSVQNQAANQNFTGGIVFFG